MLSPLAFWFHLRPLAWRKSFRARPRFRARQNSCALAFASGAAIVKTAPATIFKLAETAERSWQNQLPKIMLNIKFTDGIEVVRSQAQAATAVELGKEALPTVSR